MPNRPCIVCNTPTPNTRCRTCESAHQAKRNASRPYYQGDYRARAKKVRDAANADPSTRCRRCGGQARPGDPWQAGHVLDGDANSILVPEHRSCNARAGGQGGYR